jgi:hypothetical protein
MEDGMEFIAEVKKVSQRKTASLDQIYQIVLETDNPNILDLGKLPADVIVKVTVAVNG